MKNIICFLISIILLTISGFAAAHPDDIKESKDHPLIGRFADSVIYHYEEKAFDEYSLPLAAAESKKISKTEKLEGKVTRITYKVPAGRSTIEVLKNYEDSLTSAGYKILFTCAKNDCGEGFPGALFELNPLVDINYEPSGGLTHGDNNFQRFLSVVLKGAEEYVYATVYVSQGWWNHPIYQLDVIQTKAMQTGLVDIDAANMIKEIKTQGRIALYSFTFDTGKSELKPGAGTLLKEIAKLLEETKDLNLLIVGHTDNTGDIESNMKLSLQRAQSVVKALVEEQGVSANRLKPFGAGPLCPVAGNNSDENRAKNRRVELVAE